MGTSDRGFGTIWVMKIMSKEEQRLSLQSDLDAQKSISDRRKFGQFATPTELANEVVSFGLDILNSNTVRFLDPALGTGSFFSALTNHADSTIIEKATGIEIDSHYAIPAQELWRNTVLDIAIGDFTVLPPKRKFNFVICNPPYVRHHLIEDKERIKTRTKQFSGVELSGLAGLYCHFLLQSIAWMENDGIAGWLIPSEFMDVNYGSMVKSFLLNNVELLQIHRYDPNDVQFDDALVSSAVVWFRNRKPKGNPSVKFTYGGRLSAPNIVRLVPVSELQKESKWTRFPLQTVRTHNESSAVLGDFFLVKRGIATGNNNFFILEKDKIREFDLPHEVFRPVLPNSRNLPSDEILADDSGNPLLSRELFLLDCKLPEHEVKMRYPTLWDYLLKGKESVAKGYLCQSRKCWYYQEQREAPLFICTYMGRERNESGTSFRFILNHSTATVTNCYLALYPKGIMKEFLKRYPHELQNVWGIMNRVDSQSFIDEGRVYGGGLRKVEPKELMRVPVPEMDSLIRSNRGDVSFKTDKAIQLNMFG
ncbi:hypothetical protein AGMMS49983_02990 [Clostridia bacterium]|nr:hypothetical protein AGMMS49983_02990 [Clostridia bacterium]